MGIILADRLRHLHALVQEVHVLAVLLRVVLAGIRTLVLLLVSDSLGVVESDVVWRVAVHDIRHVSVHELLHQLTVSGVADEEAMLAEFPDFSGFHFRRNRFLECLLDIKVVIDHIDIVKEILEFLVPEANIKEYAHVELLQKLLVPRAGILVEAEVEFSLLVERQLSGRHHALDLLDAEVGVYLHALFAADDGISSRPDIEDYRHDRAEFLHGLLQVPAFVLA